VIRKEKRKISRTRGGDLGLSPLFWTFGAGIMSSTDSSEASKSATFLQMRRLKLEAIEKGQGTDYSFLVGQDKNTASVSHQISQRIKLFTPISGERTQRIFYLHRKMATLGNAAK